jgi:ethanolamine utilization microcompartment shell protein EutS
MSSHPTTVSPILTFSLGLSLAWSIPTLMPGVPGVLAAGLLGGLVAGIGAASIFKGSSSDQPSTAARQHFVYWWIAALLIGQAIIRGMASALSQMDFADIIWIVTCAIASFISGAIGATPARAVSPGFPLRWSSAMLLGGAVAAVITAYNIPVLYPILQGRIQYITEVRLGFLIGGFLAGLITLSVARTHLYFKPA